MEFDKDLEQAVDTADKSAQTRIWALLDAIGLEIIESEGDPLKLGIKPDELDAAKMAVEKLDHLWNYMLHEFPKIKELVASKNNRQIRALKHTLYAYLVVNVVSEIHQEALEEFWEDSDEDGFDPA